MCQSSTLNPFFYTIVRLLLSLRIKNTDFVLTVSYNKTNFPYNINNKNVCKTLPKQGKRRISQFFLFPIICTCRYYYFNMKVARKMLNN